MDLRTITRKETINLMKVSVKSKDPPRLGAMLIVILVVVAFGFTVDSGIAKPIIGKGSASRRGAARADRGASAHLSR